MAAALVAGPASAARMLATFDGTASGTDFTNVFGLGSTIDQVTFRAQYEYDTSLGFATTTSTYDARSGGPFFGGGVSPILWATLTLNGVTDHFDVGQDGTVNVDDLGPGSWKQTFLYTGFFAQDAHTASWDSLQLFVLDAPSPVRLTTPYIGTNQPVPTTPVEHNYAFHYHWVDGQQTEAYSFDLSPVQVQLSAVVPEPASWALLIGGFFGMGGLVRARRKTAIA